MLESYLKYIQENIKLSKFDNHFVYHLLQDTNTDSLKKYGLCSPRRLYEVDRSLFEKTTARIYKQRVSRVFDKSLKDVSNEDILDYLDNAKHRIPYFSSRSLFFNFVSSPFINQKTIDMIKPCLELSVPISFLKKYKPVIVGVKSNSDNKFGTWNEIQNNDFISKVKEEAKLPPTYKYVLAFANVTHLAVDAYHIPFNKLNIINKIY